MKTIPVFAFAGVALFLSAGSVLRHIPIIDETEPLKLAPSSPLGMTVAATGLIESNSENISLGSPFPGVVESVHVVVGANVKAGDALFTMDTRALRAIRGERAADLEAAKSKEALAQAQRNEAEARLKFVQNLPDTRIVSKEEQTARTLAFHTASASLRSAQAEIYQADAALRYADTELARAVIRATINGTVLSVEVHPGEYLSGGAGVSYILLGNINPLHVRVDIDEEQIAAVQQNADGIALLRGDASVKTAISFVREEPFVRPKRSLTGDAKERVDTRVLQLIYRIKDQSFVGRVGQQVDVFLERRKMG